MKRALVVDDELPMARLMEVILRKNGFEVEIAQGGEEALEKTSAFAPELILLDLMLPDMDGFQVLERIRGQPRLKTVPVLIVTTLQKKAFQARSQKLGANGYLTKPFTPQQLLQHVQKALL